MWQKNRFCVFQIVWLHQTKCNERKQLCCVSNGGECNQRTRSASCNISQLHRYDARPSKMWFDVNVIYYFFLIYFTISFWHHCPRQWLFRCTLGWGMLPSRPNKYIHKCVQLTWTANASTKSMKDSMVNQSYWIAQFYFQHLVIYGACYLIFTSYCFSWINIPELKLLYIFPVYSSATLTLHILDLP